MASVTIRSFAKINLSLRIGEKRADGFHEVQTILQAIDLSDRVTCERRKGPIEIRCAMPGVPVDRTNLVWRAIERLWEWTGRSGEPHSVRVTLDKRIPAQAGLGGGSSNAAAVLVALNRLWRLKLPPVEVRAIAAGVGSDVPFFLVGGTALALGRGEEVYSLQELPRTHVVLVLPAFGVSTASAYSWLDERRARGRPTRSAPSGWMSAWLPVPLANDLEAGVVAHHPAIAAIGDQLTSLGAEMAAMSGSGSAVFGLFPSKRAARVAAGRLQVPGARVVSAQFLPRGARRLPVSRSIV